MHWKRHHKKCETKTGISLFSVSLLFCFFFCIDCFILFLADWIYRYVAFEILFSFAFFLLILWFVFDHSECCYCYCCCFCPFFFFIHRNEWNFKQTQTITITTSLKIFSEIFDGFLNLTFQSICQLFRFNFEFKTFQNKNRKTHHFNKIRYLQQIPIFFVITALKITHSVSYIKKHNYYLLIYKIILYPMECKFHKTNQTDCIAQ